MTNTLLAEKVLMCFVIERQVRTHVCIHKHVCMRIHVCTPAGMYDCTSLHVRPISHTSEGCIVESSAHSANCLDLLQTE